MGEKNYVILIDVLAQMCSGCFLDSCDCGRGLMLATSFLFFFAPIRFHHFCKSEKKLILHSVFGDWLITTL